MAQKNYTLGKGDVYFARFVTGEEPGPYRFVGNTPELNLTTETETLDHVSSDEGINQVDASVPLSVTRSGSMTMDDIQRKNLALFFLGEVARVAQAEVAAGTTEEFEGAKKDDTFIIGRTAERPFGLQGTVISAVTIGGTAATEGQDFSKDEENGMVTVRDTSRYEGNMVVTYGAAAREYDQVISGSTHVQGAMRFAEDNPKGDNNTWDFPKVSVAPNGDISLKGDEWRQIPFSLNVLQPSATGTQAIYINGKPAPAEM